MPQENEEPRRIPLAPGDLLNAQVCVSERFNGDENKMLIGVAAMRDAEFPATIRNGELDINELSEFLRKDGPFYLGLTGSAEVVQRLLSFAMANVFDKQNLDEGGYSKQGVNFMRLWEDGRWFALAMNRDHLEQVTPLLSVEAAERHALVRFQVADLSQMKARSGIETVSYWLARYSSAAVATYLDEVGQQFKLQPADARASIEEIIGGEITDPLGGEFEVTRTRAGNKVWVSTHWPHETMRLENEVSEQFSLPLIDNVKGLEFELSVDPARQTLKVHVEIQQSPRRR